MTSRVHLRLPGRSPIGYPGSWPKDINYLFFFRSVAVSAAATKAAPTNEIFAEASRTFVQPFWPHAPAEGENVAESFAMKWACCAGLNLTIA